MIELMVAFVVVAIMMIGAMTLFVAQTRVAREQNEGALATQNTRAGIDLLVRELRNAGYDPRGAAAAGLTRLETDSLGWTADLNGDGDATDFGPDGDENVLYYFDAGARALIREANGVAGPVTNGLDSLRFTYLDRWETETMVANQVEQVIIEMWYATPGGVLPGEATTQVALRNNIFN
jgi:type II secretory pathway pseudopilin PulG